MSEAPRSALYVIRWEILVMAVSLILIYVTIWAIPSDYSDRLLKERAAVEKALEELKEKQEKEALEGHNKP